MLLQNPAQIYYKSIKSCGRGGRRRGLPSLLPLPLVFSYRAARLSAARFTFRLSLESLSASALPSVASARKSSSS